MKRMKPTKPKRNPYSAGTAFPIIQVALDKYVEAGGMHVEELLQQATWGLDSEYRQAEALWFACLELHSENGQEVVRPKRTWKQSEQMSLAIIDVLSKWHKHESSSEPPIQKFADRIWEIRRLWWAIRKKEIPTGLEPLLVKDTEKYRRIDIHADETEYSNYVLSERFGRRTRYGRPFLKVSTLFVWDESDDESDDVLETADGTKLVRLGSEGVGAERECPFVSLEDEDSFNAKVRPCNWCEAREGEEHGYVYHSEGESYMANVYAVADEDSLLELVKEGHRCHENTCDIKKAIDLELGLLAANLFRGAGNEDVEPRRVLEQMYLVLDDPAKIREQYEILRDEPHFQCRECSAVVWEEPPAVCGNCGEENDGEDEEDEDEDDEPVENPTNPHVQLCANCRKDMQDGKGRTTYVCLVCHEQFCTHKVVTRSQAGRVGRICLSCMKKRDDENPPIPKHWKKNPADVVVERYRRSDGRQFYRVTSGGSVLASSLTESQAVAKAHGLSVRHGSRMVIK